MRVDVLYDDDASIICDVSVAGKLIPHDVSLGSGSAWVSATIPKSAKGKLLTVKVTVERDGRSASKTVAFPIS